MDQSGANETCCEAHGHTPLNPDNERQLVLEVRRSFQNSTQMNQTSLKIQKCARCKDTKHFFQKKV